MSRQPAALPRQLGPGFSAAEARDLDVHTRRLRRLDVSRLARGLYVRSEALAPRATSDTHPSARWRARQVAAARAIAASLPNDHFFSGRTAAALWGLPVEPSGSDDLEVSTFAPNRTTRRTGLRATQILRELVRVTRHRGVPLLDPASAWGVLAARLSMPDAVALGDAVIRRPRIPGTTRVERPPLATLAELERVVDAGRRVGVAQLRAALPLLSTSSASPPESHLRLLIGEWGFPEPELDYDVYGRHGRLIGCSEFAFPEFKLAFEYESIDHMTQVKRWNRDLDKYHDYAAESWEVQRVTASLLYRRRPTLRSQLSAALMRRGWSGP